MTEPLTPVQIESKLRQLVTEITTKQQDLASARLHETEAELAMKRARLVAAHSPDCPVPSRGGATVAQRDEWIDAQIQDEAEAHRWAITHREIAVDALRAVLAVTDTAQSLNASVRQAYAMAGRS